MKQISNFEFRIANWKAVQSAIRNPRSAIFSVLIFLFLSPMLSAQTVNRIAAIVNDAVITEADVTTQMQALLQEQETDAPLAADEAVEMRRAVLRRLIEQQVLLQEAKRAEISVSAEDVLKRLEEIRGRFASEEEFRSSLKESGVSVERLKERFRDQLLIQHLIDQQIRSTIVVSPQEVAQALAKHPEWAKPGDRARASHLLIRVNEGRSEAEARALIEKIRQELLQDADFATVAKRSSEDPHRDGGGAMDWSAPGELLPELDAALFQLPVGQLSLSIQTRLGFHLLRVDERRAASSLSLMEAHRTIYEQLYQERFQQAFSRWLGDLTRKAYIEIPSEE